MQTKSLLTAFVASVILLGCAQMRPSPDDIRILKSQDRCNTSEKCKAAVSLADNCPLFHKCLKVDPYFIIVTGGAKVDITWTLAGELDQNNYSFDPTDGIKFIDDDNHVFVDCKPEGQGKKFTCKNTHPDLGGIKVFKYSIHVISVDILDPYVVNN